MARDIKVDGYDSGAAPTAAPEAAKFGRGVNDLAGIKQATERRAAHSQNLTREGNKGDRNGALKYRE